MQPEVLRLDPFLAALFQRSPQRQRRKLEIIASVIVCHLFDHGQKLFALEDQSREHRHNDPENDDAVADLHIVARLKAFL